MELAVILNLCADVFVLTLLTLVMLSPFRFARGRAASPDALQAERARLDPEPALAPA